MKYNSLLDNHCLCVYFDGTSEVMLWDINSNRLTIENYHSCGPDSLFATFYHTILKDFPYRSEENISALLKIMLDRSLSWNAYHIELEQHIMKSKSLNDVLKKVQDIRLLLAENREPFWDHLVENMGTAFSPKGTIDAYLDTFTNYLIETEADKKLFGTNMDYLCGECDGIKSWCLPKITISVSSSSSISDNIMATLFQESHLCCGREMALKETKLPKILLLTFEGTGTMLTTIPEAFELFGNEYDIVGAVRHQHHHFISLVKAQCGKWCILDDMQYEIEHFGSLDACMFSFRQRQGSGNGLQLVIATQRGWRENEGDECVNPCISQHEASPDFSIPQPILIQPAQSSSTSELPKLNETKVAPNHSRRGKRKLATEEKRRTDAERKKHARALETDEKRALRLAQNKERNKLARSKENTNERRKRLQTDLSLKQKLRATESPEKKSDRLQNVKKQMKESRAAESSEKKKDRRQIDQTKKQELRANELPEKRTDRLQKVKKQMQVSRAVESPEKKIERLQKVKNLMKESRAAESSEKKKDHRQKDQTKKQELRANELPEKKTDRLQKVKKQMQVSRAVESPEKKIERLQKVKNLMKESRAAESSEKKKDHRQKDQTKKQELRANELPEKKTDRLQKVKKQMQVSRAVESPEKKIERLQKVKNLMKDSRAAESSEKKKDRCQKDQTKKQELRANELPEKKTDRLEKVKNRMKLSRTTESSTKINNRLQKDKTKKQESRQAESPGKRKKRLDNNKIRKKVYEENETVEMKTMRLSTQSAAMNSNRSKRAFEALVSFTLEDFQHCKSCLKILLFESGTTIKSINSVAEDLSISELDRVCYSCAGAINRNNLPKLSVTNGLYVSPIPAIIKKLNILEKRHICQVQTYLTLLKLPGGQYAQKGMAIHFPADPTEHIKSLPHESSKSGIVCVSGETLRFLRRELILATRGTPLLATLHWLKRNNILYKDVVIAYDRLGVDEQELENLEETIEQSGIIPMDYDHPKIPVEQFLKRKPGSSVQFARSSGKPVSVLDKKHSDALSFPWLFPTGEGDFHTPRQIKLDYLPYIQSRILHKDPRFRTDISFLIVSTNRYETMVLSRQVNFYMRIRKPEKIKEGVNPSAISLNDIQNLNRNPDIASNSTMFMKKTRGTPAYWKDKLWDLLAKMKMLGPPDLFLTLSCDDLGWEDLQMFLKADLQSEYKNPAQAVRSDPVAVAFFCQKKMKSMIQLIMKREKILGKISDFHVRVEFQNRGSVHFHIFLWVPAAPGLHKGNTAAEMEKYIDSIISTRVPDSNVDSDLSALVRKLQTHHHTDTCKLRGDQCRFHMPRRACSKTTVHLSDLRDQGLSNFYETERCEDDSFINAYNPTILSLWKANMDLQMVNGEKGLAFYVCKYVLKSEPHELRSKLSEALNDMDYAHELDQKGRMMMLGMVTLKTRRMSAQEAAYRACGIEMIYSNRQVIKIGTLPPSRRMRRLNISKYQDKISDSDINNEQSAEDCFDDSLLEVYRKRPKQLDNLTYYQLASWYNKVKGEPKDDLRLLDDSASLKKRMKALCVRGSFVNAASDDYYYSLLLQHLPHREEKELLEGFDSAEESFLLKKNLLDQGALKSEIISSELMGIVQRLRTGMELVERIQDLDEGELADDFAAVLEDEFRFPGEVSNEPGSWIACEDDNWQNMTVATMSPEEFREKLKSLSKDQALVLKYLHMKLNDKVQNQIQLFITGNAGTGKSLLLEVIIEWFRLTQARQSGEDPVMIGAPTGLAAKNVGGKTLHSLLKLPIQHDGIQLESLPLQQKTLNKLKTDLRGKKFLIVDEISMLGEKMLIFVNERLQQIFDSDEPFGGINVIFCGDFFQLPPVKDKFCFGHQLFDEFDVLMLRKNMRQKEDKSWCTILDKIRIGKPLDRQELLSLTGRVSIPEKLRDESVDIRLFPTNREIDEENSYELAKLGADPVVSLAENVYSSNDISGGCLAEIDHLPSRVRDSGGLWNELCLAVGARVMTIKNLGDGIVNGSIGTIHSFENYANGHVKAVFVKFMDPNSGRPFQDPNRDNAIRIDRYSQEYHFKGRRLTRTQLPLIPAWAITIHKAQGLSVNSAVVSIGKTIFSHGQIYVALSRVRTLEGLHIIDSLKFSKWWQPNKKVLDFYLHTLAREIDTKEKLKSYSMGKIL